MLIVKGTHDLNLHRHISQSDVANGTLALQIGLPKKASD